MKLILLLVIGFAAVAFATDEETAKPIHIKKQTVLKLVERLQHLRNQTRETVVINDLVDEIFKDVTTYIFENGYDPTQMPDIHLSFEYKPIIITYHGELDLTKGWLQELSTLHRNGDATASEGNGFGIIKIPIAFNSLMMDYLYSAKLMNLGPEGSVYGRIDDVFAQVDVLIDLHTLEAMLMDFYLQAGDLKLEFHGNALTDWLVNLFVDLTATLLHDQIVRIADGIIEKIVRQVVDEINEIIGGIFGRNHHVESELLQRVAQLYKSEKLQLIRS